MTQYAAPWQPVHSPEPVQRPQPAPISARRAYTEVLIVFALFFAASIITAGESLTGRASAPAGGWGYFTPPAVQNVTNAAIAALVVILLSARRGITSQMLGVALPRGPEGTRARGRVIRMAALALIALIVGGVVQSGLATGHLPLQAHPSGPYLVFYVTDSLFAGVAEEMVVLAFVVSTLRQANRPVAEILLVALLLRCSYHIYYGVGVVGIAVWAAGFALLYLRFRSIIPLIILHFTWDAVQFLDLKWVAAGVIGELASIILLIAGLIAWLADGSRKARKRQARQPAEPPWPAGQPSGPEGGEPRRPDDRPPPPPLDRLPLGRAS